MRGRRCGPCLAGRSRRAPHALRLQTNQRAMHLYTRSYALCTGHTTSSVSEDPGFAGLGVGGYIGASCSAIVDRAHQARVARVGSKRGHVHSHTLESSATPDNVSSHVYHHCCAPRNARCLFTPRTRCAKMMSFEGRRVVPVSASVPWYTPI